MSLLNMYLHREESEYSTVLDEDIEFSGKIESKESLYVKGTITDSEIKVPTLLITNNASVYQNLEADILIVFGKTEGNFKIKDMLCLARGAEISGNVEVVSLQIEEGATFNGSCKMLSKPSMSTVPTT